MLVIDAECAEFDAVFLSEKHGLLPPLNPLQVLTMVMFLILRFENQSDPMSWIPRSSFYLRIQSTKNFFINNHLEKTLIFHCTHFVTPKVAWAIGSQRAGLDKTG